MIEQSAGYPQGCPQPVDNTSGRKWARFTLVVTLIVSVIANVTHAVLADSQITLFLRIPGAAIWPILSFLAIEIIVRINWIGSFSHYLARVCVLGPAIPAVIVSYEHQNRLLVLMGENLLVSRIGPLAIDGLMIGCTLALLFTRAIASVNARAEIVQSVEAEIGQESAFGVFAADMTPIERPAQRSGSLALAIAIEELQAGQSVSEAASASGMSLPTVRRYAAVIRTLKENPHATIDARKLSVRPEAVNNIRSWARLESVR